MDDIEPAEEVMPERELADGGETAHDSQANLEDF
jgi:hypothetical protein